VKALKYCKDHLKLCFVYKYNSRKLLCLFVFNINVRYAKVKPIPMEGRPCMSCAMKEIIKFQGFKHDDDDPEEQEENSQEEFPNS
jgi:hypothetical protein